MNPQGCDPSGGSRGESNSLVFPASSGCLHPLAHGSLLPYQSEQHSQHLLLLLTFCFAFSLSHFFFPLTVQLTASQFLNQGLNPCPLQQKHKTPTSGPPVLSTSCCSLIRNLSLRLDPAQDNLPIPRSLIESHGGVREDACKSCLLQDPCFSFSYEF